MPAIIRSSILLVVVVIAGRSEVEAQAVAPQNVALVNGKWFNGKSFDAQTAYSVNGRFTLQKPAAVDRTLDLAGTWIVPPFGEAHNHNIGTGVEERDKKAIQKYLADGVFYVKIQGNLPLTDETKRRLKINQQDSIDAVFSQGSLTATGGHPSFLVERILLPQGSYPGFTPETLRDHRYFTVDSEADLDKKWPKILGQHPDFIKTFLWFSDEFEKRKKDAAPGQKALDPQLLPKIVAKAHANNLRVSTHVTNAADFHNAITAGVDEIAHLPLLGLSPIPVEDAKLAASRGIIVDTTCSAVPALPRMILPEADLPQVLKIQSANLKILHENGVLLAVGSDNVSDSSIKEIEYLQALGMFDNLTLLKLWTETTPKSIFPQRTIGALSEGYEASFLALEGNPLEDLQNVRKIKIRFKQGSLIER
jgi:imidazolonepropionase-like amidohydrolase